MTYTDRYEAGRKLAQALEKFREEDPIILALPRGGVEVGYEVARVLDAPLDVMVTRKLGVPGREELGFGAVGPGGVRVVDEDTVRMLGLSTDQIEEVAERERRELQRRLEAYRGDRPMPDLAGRTVIVVDDGVATGGTARAALRAVRAMKPGKLVLAVPVAPPSTVESLEEAADEVVCLQTPAAFMAVGQWYRNFAQTTDREVVELLRRAREERESA